MADKITVTYEPDHSFRKGCISIFHEIFLEILQNRWLTWQLFKKNISVMYKQSFAGILWIFIIPIANVIVFILLNHAGIFAFGNINAPYPLFAILGMAFWQLFAAGIISAGGALTNAGSILTQINFSKKSLVFASLGKPIMSCLIQFILLGVLFLIYGIIPTKAVLLVPLVLIPIILLTLAIGFIVSLLNAIMRDMETLLALSITFLMYLTPVLYARPHAGMLSQITRYNPIYYLVSAGRDLMLFGTVQNPKGFMFSTVFSFVIFFVSLAIFHLTETRIAERI